MSMASSSSSSGGMTEAGGVGGRTEYFDWLLCFGFRGRIEPAQPLTIFRLLLFFLPFLQLESAASAGESEPCSEEEAPETTLVADSPELALWGRVLLGELWLEKGSRPKNVHRFDDLVGLGVGGSMAEDSARSSSAGIEFLRRGDELNPSAWTVGVRSRIAPAVLGREVSRDGLWDFAAGDSRPLGDPVLTNDEMLPDTA